MGILFAFTVVDCGLIIVRYGDGATEFMSMGYRTKRATFLVSIYVVLLIIASILLTFNSAASHSPIDVSDSLVQAALALYGLSIVPIIVFFFLPQNKVSQEGFHVPLVPLIPAAAIGVNILMAASHLAAVSYIAFAVWMALGTLIYLFYGINHSQLRLDRAKGVYETLDMQNKHDAIQ